MPQNSSRGYTSSARVSNEPGAYYPVQSTDFGQLSNQAALTLAYNAGAGSLAMSTARAAVTFITTEGETMIGVDSATVSIAAGSGAFTITKPSTPTNGATVLGWRVYSSSGGAGSELLNVAGASTTQVQQNFVTAQGVLSGFPLTTASVQVLIYGAGQAVPASDRSGIQAPMPSIAANTTVDYFFRVPNTANRWRVQKSVEWMRPAGVAEPAGIVIGPMDVVNPVYPGTSQVIPAIGEGTVAGGGTVPYMVLGGNLFGAAVGGTTASTFIGFAAFNTNLFGTTTDGTVTWICYGKATLIRTHMGNTSGSPAIPGAQEYDLFAA